MSEKAAFESDFQRMLDINEDLALQIIDAVPSGLSFTTDLTCKVIRHSRVAAEFFRIKSGDSFSHSASLNHLVKLFHKGKEITPAEMPIQQAVWKGVKVKEQEIEFVWNDGVHKVAVFNSTPIYNHSGDIIGAVATFEDITEKKQIEEAYRALNVSLENRVAERTQALLESEQQLAAELWAAVCLQELSTQLIQADNIQELYDKVLDTAVSILQADFASLQLFHPKVGSSSGLELLGHRGFSEDAANFWDWVTPDSKSSCGIAMKTGRRVFTADVTKCEILAGSTDLELYLLNGILSVQSTPLLSRSGRLLGVFSTHWRQPHELTDREKRSLDVLARQAADLIERKLNEESLAAAYEELQIADKRKDEFLGALSHEIRNPLASIMLSLSLLKRTEPDGEQTKKIIVTMDRQVAQLSRLVDDLLDVTRITQNKIVLQKEQVELNELVRRTAEDYISMFQEKGITLKMEPFCSPLYVEADPVRLSQVVGNLLHNAAKFTGERGFTRVTVSENVQAKGAVISIEDSGIGISPEMHRELFKPFVQGNSSLDRSSGGLGLGLALVKGLIKLHGGEVSVSSEGPGKGAVFTVYLPVIKRLHSREIRVAEAADFYDKRRVLVIEDIQDMAETLRALLVDEGHEVMVAYDGIEGLAKVKEFYPEIVLCDIGLPGLDGYQVAKAIRADKTLKDVVLVSLTGYARPQDLKEAKEAGFHLQLAKPVDLDTLREALAKV